MLDPSRRRRSFNKNKNAINPSPLLNILTPPLNSSASIIDAEAKQNATAKRIFDNPDNSKPGFFDFGDRGPVANPANTNKTLAEKLYPTMNAAPVANPTPAIPTVQPVFPTAKLNDDFKKQFLLTGDEKLSRVYAIKQSQKRTGNIQQLQNDFLASGQQQSFTDDDSITAFDQASDIGRGLVIGVAKAGHNINKLIPGATQLGKLFADGAKAIGIDGPFDPPKTVAGKFVEGRHRHL